MAFATIGDYVATQDAPLPFEPTASKAREPVTVFVVIRHHPHGGIYLLVLPDVAEELSQSFYHYVEGVPVHDRAYSDRQSDGSPFCLRWDAIEAIY